MDEDYTRYGGQRDYSDLFTRTSQDFTGEDVQRLHELLSQPHRRRLELEPATSAVLVFAPGTLGAD